MPAKKFKPRVYQKETSDSIVENPLFALLLDMGLGKTAAMLYAICELIVLGGDKKETDFERLGKVLVVAPLRVIQCVWGQEIEKWSNFSHLRWQSLAGDSPTKRNKNCEIDADIYGINPESLVWLLENRQDFLEDFDTLVIDESTKFKNPTSKRFRCLKNHLDIFDNRYILTGTPIPNKFEDIWSQIYILDQGARLGKNITTFRARYFRCINRGNFNEYILNPGAERLIYEAISDISIRLSSDDYLDLPEMIYNEIDVELPKNILKHYLELEKDFFSYMDGEDFVAVNAAVAAGKCRQFANGGMFKNQDIFAGDYNKPKETVHVHDAKVKAVIDLVDSLNGDPCLIAYEFQHDLESLKQAFPKAPILGRGLKEKDVVRLVENWNKGLYPILLCQPSSMGHGLNMQDGGRNAIWFSISWNLEVFDQFNKRLHRSGQERPVYIHLLKALNTIDEGVIKLLTMKSNNQNSFLNALHSYRRKTHG